MTIVVFKSKAEVFSFLQLAASVGLSGQITSTPTDLKIGCGLSVKINGNYLKAKEIIGYYGFSSFYGIFSVKREGTKRVLQRLV